jgi:CBS-domain-containing membrane protein
MTYRTVREVMTRNVFTVNRYASFKSVAVLLADAEVSAVPVVDDMDRVLGIVSEADLLAKELTVCAGQGGDAGRMRPVLRDRAEADSVDGLMSPRVVTARPDWSVAAAARVMDARQVKRLPVVDQQGVLIGIVSRSDLLRVFLRPDREILREVVDEVLADIGNLPAGSVRAHVRNGVVTLHGQAGHPGQARRIRAMCARVEGVVAVHDRLSTLFSEPPAPSPQ